MKKTVLILLTILLLVACTASGTSNTVVFVDPNAVQAGAYGSLGFRANEYQFGIYDPTKEVFEHITSSGTFADVSCAFEGEDTYYFFNGFEIMANVIDGEERVTAINLLDDTVKTPDGLYIGMSAAELNSILGTSLIEDGLHTEIDGTAQRNITVVDGTVRAISYLPAN